MIEDHHCGRREERPSVDIKCENRQAAKDVEVVSIRPPVRWMKSAEKSIWETATICRVSPRIRPEANADQRRTDQQPPAQERRPKNADGCCWRVRPKPAAKPPPPGPPQKPTGRASARKRPHSSPAADRAAAPGRSAPPRATARGRRWDGGREPGHSSLRFLHQRTAKSGRVILGRERCRATPREWHRRPHSVLHARGPR